MFLFNADFLINNAVQKFSFLNTVADKYENPIFLLTHLHICVRILLVQLEIVNNERVFT